MYYINLFFVYSILGHLLENTVVKMYAPNYESGIMFGYWTPVYGLGVIVIVLIYNFLHKKVDNKILRAVLLFVLSAVILSLLELLGGILIEHLFHRVFWNYEDFKYNFGKYISLETACIWGGFSLLLIFILKPLLDKIIKKIPKWLSYILIGLFIIDFFATLIIKK